MSVATFASAPGRIVSTFVPRKRRGAELFLLVLALIVGVERRGIEVHDLPRTESSEPTRDGPADLADAGNADDAA